MKIFGKKSTIAVGVLAFAGIVTSYGLAQADENEFTVVNQNSYGDYDVKKIVSNSVENADELLQSHDMSTNTADETEIRKWIVRVSIDNQMMGSNSNIEEGELLKEAEKAYEQRELTLQFAEDVYGIDVYNEDEIKNYIKEEMVFVEEDEELKDFTSEIAENLSMTDEQFIYDWEYDNFQNNYVWNKIKPELESKYPIQEDEELMDYHERLLNEYDNEIQEYKEESS